MNHHKFHQQPVMRNCLPHVKFQRWFQLRIKMLLQQTLYPMSSHQESKTKKTNIMIRRIPLCQPPLPARVFRRWVAIVSRPALTRKQLLLLFCLSAARPSDDVITMNCDVLMRHGDVIISTC
uniref:Uncharacterized protein n=1 Tax=Ciona intestinalis TaxID=7719 RepID=F6QN87_CIOIN